MGRGVGWGRLLLVCVAALGGSACSGSTADLSNANTPAEGGSETGANVDTDASGAHVDAEAGANVATDADAGASVDADADAGASLAPDADAGASLASDADADTARAMDAEASTNSEAGPDANEDAPASADADAQSEPNANSEASADGQVDATVGAEAGDSVDAEAGASADADATMDVAADADATMEVAADATLVSIAINNPPPSDIDQGASSIFSATVSGAADKSATFAIGTGCGSVTASRGAYVAPTHWATACTLTATSVADNTKTSTASVSVNPVSVALSPATAAVAPNQTSGFVATVTGTVNKAVTYGVLNGGVGGTINSLGIYYAPGMTGSDTMIAISAANATKSATASASVTTTVTVSVLPSTATLNQGQSQSFSASVTGNANGNVNWSVLGGTTNGTITPNGIYTAPNSNGAYTVIATSVADGSKTGSASVTVTSAPQVAVSISPPSVTVAAGQSQHFAATVSGNADQSVTYSVLEAAGGVVDGAGNYAAPLGSGIYHLVATSNADTSKTATATVTVTNGPPVTIAISPSSVTLPPSGAKAFTATVTGSTNTDAVSSTPSCGTVDTAGNYTAPATAPSSCTLTVTSAADSTKSATATVTVSSTVAVNVNPSPTTVTLGGTAQFVASVTGAGNTLVDWSVIRAAATR